MLVGGGHAHVQVLRRFGMKPEPGVRITVVARELLSPYSGMLPGHVAGAYTFDEMHIDLAGLSRFAGARLIEAEVCGVDPEAQVVRCAGRPDIRYDVLSLNTGAVPEAPDSGIAVKPIGRFLPEWRAASEKLSPGATVAIVGAGAGGVELALAVRAARPDLSVSVVGRSWLPGFNRSAQAVLREACLERGVVLAQEDAPNAATENSDLVLWVTSVRAPDWLAASGLACDDQGFVRVSNTLQALKHATIFAAGDVACLDGQERPKAGVYAVRAGPFLAHNLRAVLRGEPLRQFAPQRHFLTLVGVGDGTAVAAKWGLAVRSALMWRWKDWIDRRFMQRFQDLPTMASEQPVPLPADLAADAPDPMRCGGCGAKLGADLLSRVLARLPITARADVTVGIGDDAAVVQTAESTIISTDGLRAMLDDTYRFGRVVAHHNLNDLFAMGAVPATALATATVPVMAEAMMEDELTQLLMGAVDVLEAHDVTLVGGHSGEGAELFLSLTVMGRPGDSPFRKGGLQANQVIVLTKPIGTGVLLAADMRGAASSRDVSAALDEMDRSNAAAVPILARHGAIGVTDVTGFGLAGHLSEMLRASELGATLEASAVPVLGGALEALADGVQSSLQANNEQALYDFSATLTDRVRLLCDPQTSGGLLAGVPIEAAAACVSDLREAGFAQAAVIGHTHHEPWQIVE